MYLGAEQLNTEEHTGSVPVEGLRAVVGEHLVRELGMHSVGELAGLLNVGHGALHPDQVGVRRKGPGTVDAELYASLSARRKNGIVNNVLFLCFFLN